MGVAQGSIRCGVRKATNVNENDAARQRTERWRKWEAAFWAGVGAALKDGSPAGSYRRYGDVWVMLNFVTNEGLVQLDERKLTVGASAKLTADIIAREVVVYGTVKGKVQATDRIEIKKDGSVKGDLTTARIVIEDGANFKGSIGVDKIGEKESGGESFSRAASAAAGVGSKTI